MTDGSKSVVFILKDQLRALNPDTLQIQDLVLPEDISNKVSTVIPNGDSFLAASSTTGKVYAFEEGQFRETKRTLRLRPEWDAAMVVTKLPEDKLFSCMKQRGYY